MGYKSVPRHTRGGWIKHTRVKTADTTDDRIAEEKVTRVKRDTSSADRYAAEQEALEASDGRASLKPKPEWKSGDPTWERLLAGPIMAPLLYSGRGLIFQYAPQLTLAPTANWTPQSFTHSNYEANAWESSSVPEIMLTAEFTAESDKEAKYMLAVIHFLKSVTKGGFGQFDPDRGVPPAVYRFNYLGDYQFKNVPVIITSSVLTYDNTIDYIPISVEGKPTYVPTMMTININLRPQYNPSKLRDKFKLSDFREGKYLGGNEGLL